MKVLPSVRRAAAACAGAVAAVLVAACAAPPPQATSVGEMPFEQAVAQATDGLVGQVQKGPALLAKLNKRTVVLDPMLDAATGQQTAATALLETRVSERLAAKPDVFEILPFQSANLSKAQLLLTGTMTRVEGDGTTKKRALQINLALTDLKTGTVAAQASAIARDDGLDHTPLPYYRDSPVLVKDKVIEGYARTSATPPGQRGDAFYLERINEAMLINEATSLYNQERYVEALGRYRSALAMPTGEQLRVVNGAFLSELWGIGGLAGRDFAQAFYVKCDGENNTSSTIAAGEVHIEIGIAPAFPAEFVVIRIGQYESDASIITTEV